MRQGSVYRRVLQQAWPCRYHLLGITLLSFLAIPLSLLLPVPLKIAVDGALGDLNLPPVIYSISPWLARNSLVLAIALSLAIALASNLLALVSGYLQTFTGERLVWDFRARLLEHAERLSMSFHDGRGAFDSSYRIQHDAACIQYILVQGIIPTFNGICMLAAMLWVCTRIDPTLAAIGIAITPVLILLTHNCSRMIRQRSTRVKELDCSAMSVVEEVLTSIRVVQAFGQEEREHHRFVARSDERVTSQVLLSLLQGAFNLLIGLILAIGTGAVLYFGVRHLRMRLLTVGNLILVMAYISQMYEPLRLIATRLTELQSWATSVDRAFEILDQVPDLREPKRPMTLARASGDVSFRNVSFSYAKGSGVQRISLDIVAGQHVGIVGPSGAGKSTLLNLLMRFYDPQDGAILLDGIDIRNFSLRWLRSQFSIVLQEPVLFSSTIAENIAYASPLATDAQIISAARAANCHEFILRQPEGYNTILGERGARLSGGERQRIALARAFLRDTPMLILDEPTSSVDHQTEASIMEATESLMRGRTAFTIAHRLASLRSCDLIAVLENGHLLEVLDSVESISFKPPRVMPSTSVDFVLENHRAISLR